MKKTIKYSRKQMPVKPGLLWCSYNQHYAPDTKFKTYSGREEPTNACTDCQQLRSNKRYSAKKEEKQFFEQFKIA